MHKYSTETYKTFFSEPADYHVWQAVVPRWAFKYDFLLYGILSVTALHTALALDPVDARPYLDASMDFQSKALRPFQEALQNISLENVDAAFAYSRITIVKGIAFRQVAADINSADDTSMLESIFLLFKLVDGVMAITDMSHEQLRKSALIPRNFWGTAEFTLDSDTNEALTRLSELNTRLNINDDTQYCTIDSAIFRLRQCWQRFHRHGDSTSVLSWLAMAGKEFVIAAMNYESLPLLVLAYWGSLLQQLKGASWWAANSGSALVSDILETLCRSNVDFGEAALWPKRKAGV
ncbi:hypothetical protein BJY04DRAFT_214734 [Aspergillus karnatakaensis]|uniref:uncharacterized protein n=1 Tax=Aspergillus karnatakaensis TaxID=1810916 RepID=UPI003CCCFB58